MNNWRKNFLYKTFRYLGHPVEHKLEQLLYLIKCAKFFSQKNTLLFDTRFKMYNHVIETYKLSNQRICYFEFGVWKGESIKFWASGNSNEQSTFFGFDTFEGLPEAYGKLPKGFFTTDGNFPETNDKRISFHKGLFQDTLPTFIAQHKELLTAKNKIIHLDADLYSSTLFVLIELYPYFKPGDIILFDEFFTLSKNADEFRGFIDFLAIRNFKFKEVAKTTKQLAIVCL